MATISIQRPPSRLALVLPGGTKENPITIIPLGRVGTRQELCRSELDELVRATLEKRGLGHMTEKIVEAAEKEYEKRRKTYEASQYLRKLMKMKAEGATLISAGRQKWVPASFRKIGG